jgi:16S rRNA (guanine966-N2)-methyltransferase
MDLDGARVLDLFAGSGAIALEALSRGAAEATLVESDRAAARVIAANVKALDVHANVVTQRVESFLEGPATPFDLVFADPPYSAPDDELVSLLASLNRGWLSEQAVVVIERSRRSSAPAWPDEIAAVKERRYGEAVLWYGRKV